MRRIRMGEVMSRLLLRSHLGNMARMGIFSHEEGMPVIRRIDSERVRERQDVRLARIDFQSLNSPEGEARFLAPRNPAGLAHRESRHGIVPGKPPPSFP